MKILVAMSGGVDSSVVAHLLHEQGHELIGVRFTLWTDPLAPAIYDVLPTKCCTTQNIARADSVAKKLRIPLKIVSLDDAFKKTVVDPYLKAHEQGLTPNPCIGCNRTIKFGKLLTLMRELGCDHLATGHYARIEHIFDTEGKLVHRLLEATDRRKDQSYYLYGLTDEQLENVLFPLGSLTKTEVYALAEKYGVPLPSSYRESQDLCFFPEKKPSAFLNRHLPAQALRPGDITTIDGRNVGVHRGLPHYTLGQRHGLGIGGLKIPLQVVRKDIERNALIVAEKGSVMITSVRIHDAYFRRDLQVGIAHSLECRTRSLSLRRKGAFVRTGPASGTFTFESALPPQSPGQSLVLYDEEEVVGGGEIEGEKEGKEKEDEKE